MPTRPRRLAQDPSIRLWSRKPPVQGRVALAPTRFGWWFCITMLLMVIASTNYGLNLGFGLTFLLCGAVFASALHTRRNVQGIGVTPLQPPPVFAKEVARFPLQLTAPTFRRNVVAAFELDDDPPGTDLPPGRAVIVHAALLAHRRGRLKPGPLVLQTIWPLGLFRAWTIVELPLECTVWPAPAGAPPAFSRGGEGDGDGEGGGPGVDDFKELRPYVYGDPPQRISWKASTRGQGLFTKTFQGLTGKTLEVDFDQIGDATALQAAEDGGWTQEQILEGKLAIMSAMVLKAHGLTLEFALQLPGHRIEPGEDPLAHRNDCLSVLALFRSVPYGRGAEVEGGRAW